MKNVFLILVCTFTVSCGKTTKVEESAADPTVIVADTTVDVVPVETAVDSISQQQDSR